MSAASKPRFGRALLLHLLTLPFHPNPKITICHPKSKHQTTLAAMVSGCAGFFQGGVCRKSVRKVSGAAVCAIAGFECGPHVVQPYCLRRAKTCLQIQLQIFAEGLQGDASIERQHRQAQALVREGREDEADQHGDWAEEGRGEEGVR